MPTAEKTTTVAAVLLVPAQGREGLLKHGPLNAHPPEAMQQEDGTWGGCGYQWWMHRPRPCALALGWDGETSGAGCYAAVDDFSGAELLVNDVGQILRGTNGPDVVDHLRKSLDHLGTVLFIDAEGQEVSGG